MIQATFLRHPDPVAFLSSIMTARLSFQKVSVPEILGDERIGPQSFRPAWPSCRWRALIVNYPNGYLIIQGQCHHALSGHYLQDVVPKQCSDCLLRSPIPACQP